ncbi:uncharacterized protein LY89DRAFT_667688 [Mollisia scopiformis]|uniref:Uncharacterized protein n=1 Tax=Mollisia scopiformis TaxID=149040 RepID=A0A194XFR2_MOLSC|nr:uncharacterized protein LY89DRAFT_667688 [Mollisia scopiformis]KUJ18612.1 hypothetical protein LY89DRAFT_667688 [Mollisia scopiformis]
MRQLRILNELVNRRDPGTHVQDALEHCDSKVQLLLSIVREFEPDFTKHSGRVRLWKAFKAARKEKKLKRFRDSLQETKTTLLLALCRIQMPPAYVEEDQVRNKPAKDNKDDEKKSHVVVEVEEVSDPDLPPIFKDQDLTQDGDDDGAELPKYRPTTKPNFRKMATDFPEAELQASLGNALQLAAENYFRGGAFEKAMSETIHRVATIQTTYHYGGKDKTPNSENEDTDAAINHNSDTSSLDLIHSGSKRRASQSRICQRTSATGVVLGTIWLRTTSVQVNSHTGKSVDIVSSFTFSPSWWLTKVGVKYGVEANLFATATGWQFNFNPIRAVPDDSPIFNACRKGNLSTVRFLLSEGDASVRDTNSKGWTPLHFASLAESETSVDICEFLISEGADKTALVFEGPSENALSPVTIFTATGKKRPAEMKIKMLRLFEDCIDMSEPDSDGWTIIADLVSAFNLENVPQTSNSITWFLRSLKPQSMVAFGPKTLWHGLQHAVRSFIDMEQKWMGVRKRLNSIVGGGFPESYGITIAYWIALLVIGKNLMPMLLIAGSMLHIEGYDYDPDSAIDPNLLAKQLPFLYEAWAKALTDSIETMDEVLNSEFDITLEVTGWSEDILRGLKSRSRQSKSTKADSQHCCSVCRDDYSLLGHGLVEPRWITFIECLETKHRNHCSCQELLEYYKRLGYLRNVSVPESDNTDDSDSECEVFHDAESDLGDNKKDSTPEESSWMVECEHLVQVMKDGNGKNPFQDVAAHLYRCHARVWLGSYQAGEMFCGSCFLQSEGYIDEQFKEDWDLSSSMPASFVS